MYSNNRSVRLLCIPIRYLFGIEYNSALFQCKRIQIRLPGGTESQRHQITSKIPWKIHLIFFTFQCLFAAAVSDSQQSKQCTPTPSWGLWRRRAGGAFNRRRSIRPAPRTDLYLPYIRSKGDAILPRSDYLVQWLSNYGRRYFSDPRHTYMQRF